MLCGVALVVIGDVELRSSESITKLADERPFRSRAFSESSGAAIRSQVDSNQACTTALGRLLHSLADV